MFLFCQDMPGEPVGHLGYISLYIDIHMNIDIWLRCDPCFGGRPPRGVERGDTPTGVATDSLEAERIGRYIYIYIYIYIYMCVYI